MLKGLFRRKASRRAAHEPTTTAADPDDCIRAASFIRRARELLEPVASCTHVELLKEQTKLGGPEVLGVLVRVAKLHNPAEARSTSSHTLERLRASGEAVVGMLASMMLNWSVLFSLLLTVYTSMALLACGSS